MLVNEEDRSNASPFGNVGRHFEIEGAKGKDLLQ
jgi:hypothetical protein